MAIFIFVVASAIAVLTIRRHRHLASLHGLRFHEEDPAAIFEGFHLSEGLAARAAAAASTTADRVETKERMHGSQSEEGCQND